MDFLKKFLPAFLMVFFSLIIFSVSAQNRTFESSNLPIVIIDTQGNIIVDEPKVTASMGIIDNGEGNRNFVTDTPNEYNGYIGIEYRGESSQHWDKKSYGVETRDAQGENNNVSIFGMPEENDWVLYGPYADKTLIRNALMYQLGSEISEYAPRTRFVELVINDEYMGVYLFTEKVKKDKGRVNISKPTNENISGGYLVEMISNGSLKEDETHFKMNHSKKEMVVKYPKPSKIKQEQLDYIAGYFNDFETALNSPSFADDSLGYAAYIDLPSFLNQMLLSEAFNQLDAFCHSTFFYKRKNEKLRLGPGWDYNRSMGNAEYYNSWRTDVWILKEVYSTDPDGWYRVNWPERLMQDTSFMRKYANRWFELRKSTFSLEHIYGLIDSYVDLLEESRERNFEKYDVIGVDINNKYVFDTYEDEVQYMKDWIYQKFSWLDEQFSMTDNLALNATVTASGYEDKNPPAHAIDGDYSTHWSSEVFPQWIELDLGKVKRLNKTVLLPYKERAYQYTVEVKAAYSDDYTVVVDRSGNIEGGIQLTDTFDSIDARYVKLTVTGAYNYDGDWCSVNEFKVFGKDAQLSGNSEITANKKLFLDQNYPNPFQTTTTIKYNVPESGFVSLYVYNVYGSLVAKLVDENKLPGNYNVVFEAGKLPPGMYLYALNIKGYSEIKRMILIK